MSDYAAFLDTKTPVHRPRGMTAPTLASHLFPFQRHCAAFGLEAGSFGCYLDTGLGKTAVELEWCAHAAAETNGRALILTPLAVARQIESEGRRWGYDARVIRSAEDVREGINICNYDRLHLLDPQAFGAIALDEASILRAFTGVVSNGLIQSFAGHRFRMAATATPAPNDHMELGQQSAFLGIMPSSEMLMRWFVSDQTEMGRYRLKHHGVHSFFDWMASWSRMAEHPRDLGDETPGYDLPELRIVRHHAHETDPTPIGGLFGGSISATTMHDLKRHTLEARAAVVADLVRAEPHEPWLIWCDTNYEADALISVLPSAVEVRGSQRIDEKEDALAAFLDGTASILVSKPAVCGLGLNLQHCARMVYVGRSFSYEDWYQSVRRCWRFGQRRPVHVHLVVADGEDTIGRVIDRKAGDHAVLRRQMADAMARALGHAAALKVAYAPTAHGALPAWL